MKDKPVVFLDGDDTLWKTQEIYDDAKNQFAAILKRADIIDKDIIDNDIIKRLDNIDAQRVPLRGFTLNRFLESMLIIYAQISTTRGLTWNEDVEEEIWNFEKLLTRPPRLYEETLQALKLLHQKTQLYLLSAGSSEIQKEKVNKLGINSYFEEIFIVPSKNKDVFLEILTKLDQSPSSSWMVGNSLTSDVYPAMGAGMHSIHINRGTWKYDDIHPSQTKEDQYYRAKDLIEASAIIINFYEKE